jgi:hypothetical protein
MCHKVSQHNDHSRVQVFLFGGKQGDDTNLNTVRVMDTGSLLWKEPDVNGSLPCPRCLSKPHGTICHFMASIARGMAKVEKRVGVKVGGMEDRGKPQGGNAGNSRRVGSQVRMSMQGRQHEHTDLCSWGAWTWDCKRDQCAQGGKKCGDFSDLYVDSNR